MSSPTVLERQEWNPVIEGEAFRLVELTGAGLTAYLAKLEALLREGTLQAQDRFFAGLLGRDPSWVAEHLPYSVRIALLQGIDQLNGIQRTGESAPERTDPWLPLCDLPASRYGRLPGELWETLSPRQILALHSVSAAERWKDQAALYEAMGWKVDWTKAPRPAGQPAKPQKLSPAELERIREGAKQVTNWGPTPPKEA